MSDETAKACARAIVHALGMLAHNALSGKERGEGYGLGDFEEIVAELMASWERGWENVEPSAPPGPTGEGAAVPRGHCNRCDRCGWEYGADRGQCRPDDCSMRPLPDKRTACAGCGAPFVAAPEPPGEMPTPACKLCDAGHPSYPDPCPTCPNPAAYRKWREDNGYTVRRTPTTTPATPTPTCRSVFCLDEGPTAASRKVSCIRH